MAKTVLVYGGAGGIGGSTAKTLQQAGYKLHLVGRDEKRLKAFAEPIGASITVGDVLENDTFKRASEAAERRPGRIGLRYWHHQFKADSIV